jgi:hypothetical protein
MVELHFVGVAPILKGTTIEILVDNPDKPSEAYQIEECDRGITYTNAELKKAEMKAIIPNFRFAEVESVVVYGAQNETVLTTTQLREHR